MSDWVAPESADESKPTAAAIPPSPATPESGPRPTGPKEQRSPRRPTNEPPVEVEAGVEDSSPHPTRERRTATYLRDYACRNIRRQNLAEKYAARRHNSSD